MTIDQLQDAIHAQIMQMELDLVYQRSRLCRLVATDADEEIIDEAQCSIAALESDHDQFSSAWNINNTVELWNKP
jgi:hypothetical protein